MRELSGNSSRCMPIVLVLYISSRMFSVSLFSIKAAILCQLVASMSS